MSMVEATDVGGRAKFGGQGSNMRDPYYAEVVKLREQLDDAMAQIDTMRELLNPPGMIFPESWALTGKESIVLKTLMAVSSITKEQLLTSMYDTEPDVEIKIVDVFICKLRTKLSPLGIKIETIWGAGYRISVAMKALVNEAVEVSKAGLEWTPGEPVARPGNTKGMRKRGQSQSLLPRLTSPYSGAELKDQRHTLGLSQIRVAAMAGLVTPEYVKAVEDGLNTSNHRYLIYMALRTERTARMVPHPTPTGARS